MIALKNLTKNNESKMERHLRMFEKHGLSSTLFCVKTNTQNTFPKKKLVTTKPNIHGIVDFR